MRAQARAATARPVVAQDAHRRSLPVAAVVTRTLVDRDDPHFREPSKPIGRYLPESEARVMMEHGQVWQDRGAEGWRRVD